ncbi:MAG: hypothetical protein RQ824_01970 [bacterium]|nr:hypothetical protein [bacterium]
MRNSYYYLIASLPYLSFQKPQALSISEFSLRCNSCLNRNDVDLIQCILSGNLNKAAKSLKVVGEWLSWDIELRGKLAGLRAKAKGRDESPDLTEPGAKALNYNLESHKLAMDIFSAASPMDADELHESARWRMIEALEHGQYFNLEWLALYCLKLKIMERRESFDTEAGMDRVAVILTAAKGAYGTGKDEELSDAA